MPASRNNAVKAFGRNIRVADAEKIEMRSLRQLSDCAAQIHGGASTIAG
jgi:hypothetical protein